MLKTLKTWLKKINWKKVLPVCLVLYVFGICLTAAYQVKYNTPPDEGMKYELAYYISENGELPRGDEPSLINNPWGQSYAFKPYIPYILSAIIRSFILNFTDDVHVMIFAMRIVNVLLVTGYAIMIVLASKRLFKGAYRGLFIVLATLIPQILYIGGYLNNDSMALFAIGFVIYAWTLGLESKWNWKSCIMLGLSTGVLALSYYNAFGYLLCSVLLFVGTMLADKQKLKNLLKKGLVIFAIAFALSGWFYIRNAVLYNGDAFDLHTSGDCAEQHAADEYKPSQHTTIKKTGRSAISMVLSTDWLRSTVQSFFATFGGMDKLIHYQYYIVYESIYVAGIFGALVAAIYLAYYFVKKRKRMVRAKLQIPPSANFKMSKNTKAVFHISMVTALIIPVVLAIYYSYAHDYSPQGRYVLPSVVPLVYYITYGYQFLLGGRDKVKQNIATILIIIVMVFLAINISTKYIFTLFPW